MSFEYIIRLLNFVSINQSLDCEPDLADFHERWRLTKNLATVPRQRLSLITKLLLFYTITNVTNVVNTKLCPENARQQYNARMLFVFLHTKER